MKNNTINKKEIEKFSKIAEEWWNPNGKFKPLHKFNPIRIAYIKDNIIQTYKIDQKKKSDIFLLAARIKSNILFRILTFYIFRDFMN